MTGVITAAAQAPRTPFPLDLSAPCIAGPGRHAIAADHYEALEQCVQDVRDAAQKLHVEWEASGDPDCLAAAQGLDIKGARLHGLHAMRLHHMEWLSQTPVVSPQSLALVLPLFEDAACRSDAGGARAVGLGDAELPAGPARVGPPDPPPS